MTIQHSVTGFVSSLLASLILLLAACSQQNDDENNASSSNGSNNQTEKPTVSPAYIELGDLSALQTRGKLRLLAPRFDGADALPREDIPVQHYQRIAEEFSNSLGLSVEWIFVDGFDQLVPMLEMGSGDLIVTNLTQTKSRAERVDFTPPLNRVNEVVIAPKSHILKELKDLSSIALAIPDGTAYLDSIDEYNLNAETPLQVQIIAADTSDTDLLDGLNSGLYQATILDSNIATQLLLDYPELQVGPAIRKDRAIGWAVRKNSPQLLQALNLFLVSHFLTSTTYQSQERDFTAIKEHGRIRMLTLNNPASYFMWRGDLMGFDYELAKQFADQHNLHLAVILKNSIPELIEALQQGEGDFIAASLTRSEARQAEGLAFSRPYLIQSEQIVGRDDDTVLENLDSLTGKVIGVNPNTVFYERIQNWQQQGITFEIKEFPEALTEELFDRLVNNEFDLMMADSHLVSMELAYRDGIEVKMDFPSDANIAWATRPEQTVLLKTLNDFISKEYRGLIYNVTFNKYFVNERKIRNLQANRVLSDSQLSPYDDLVQKAAEQYGMDWRLITAQMFQESRFKPKAKSFAGALGLMQVMPRTAKEFGYSNIQDPNNGIEAGVAYLNWLADRFPGDIDFQERIYFQLAAYNAGAGHVRDARRLAKQLGYNRDRWFDHVEKAMLLLSKPDYYKKARFGYVRGSEPVAYVREIRARYLAYLNTSQ